ncbi:hypothetical protein VIGAN_07150200, partial [Vigna angularis var. angularis]
PIFWISPPLPPISPTRHGHDSSLVQQRSFVQQVGASTSRAWIHASGRHRPNYLHVRPVVVGWSRKKRKEQQPPTLVFLSGFLVQQR